MIGTCIEEFLFISSELSISYDRGLETNEILEEGVVVGCGDLGLEWDAKLWRRT